MAMYFLGDANHCSTWDGVQHIRKQVFFNPRLLVNGHGMCSQFILQLICQGDSQLAWWLKNIPCFRFFAQHTCSQVNAWKQMMSYGNVLPSLLWRAVQASSGSSDLQCFWHL
jgi:hypothetical protein